MLETMNQLKNQWYAVHTRPRWERKVARELEKKNIEHYCPLNRVFRQWSDRKKTILEPLFTSYVFVRLADTNQLEIRKIDGIVNFVYWLKKPALIRDEEIDVIKKFLNEYENIKIEKSSVNVSDQVKVISGPLMERIGNVLEVMDKTLRIWLPSLGYNISAEIQRSNVQILSPFMNEKNSQIAL